MTIRGLGQRLVHRWWSLPPRTIRMRLTAVYGGLVMLCGAALLGITYGIVSSQYSTAYFLNEGLQANPAPVAVKSSSSGFTSGFSVPRGVLEVLGAGQSSAARGTLLAGSGIALGIMSLIAIGVGWIVAGRTLKPLRAITTAAQEISASNLNRRLALSGPNDELRQLGDTFDALLERLEKAFDAQRQFAANVAHELRTPLTYQRTLVEVALADPDVSVQSLRGAYERALAAGQQQERLIDALLVLARSQHGLERREPVDLEPIAKKALAGVNTGGLSVEQALEPAVTDGDSRLIERLVANLLNNAVTYNRPGGHVAVTTRTTGAEAIVAVTNSGPVISPEKVDRLFEPFQRLDGARTSGGGLGLGLSIVKAIAEAHGARIVTSLPTDGGLAIEVRFLTRKTSTDGARDQANDSPDNRSAALTPRSQEE